jgi:hypothetical protein
MRLVLVAMFTANAVLAQQTPSRPIFDGRTLSGWRGDPAIWRVENGAIVGSSVGRELRSNSFLVLDARAPADFEFVADVRFEGDNNGGVQYRSREQPGYVVAGYQADIDSGDTYSGILYEERGRGILCLRGQRMTIAADGTALGTQALGAQQNLRRFHCRQASFAAHIASLPRGNRSNPGGLRGEIGSSTTQARHRPAQPTPSRAGPLCS